MPVNAVTFDVGGTLIEPWPSVGHVYAEVARRYGTIEATAQELNSRFKEAWNRRGAFNDTRAGWEELVSEVFRGLVSPGICAAFFPEIYEQFAQPSAWRVFDDVESTLESLASHGVRLGVISNWDERLRVLLRRLDLERYFEVIAISCEVGFSKPSPVIFERAAAQFGVAPGLILHVGDSLEMDIAGAAAAGFQSRRIYRGPEAREDDLRSLCALSTIAAVN